MSTFVTREVALQRLLQHISGLHDEVQHNFDLHHNLDNTIRCINILIATKHLNDVTIAELLEHARGMFMLGCCNFTCPPRGAHLDHRCACEVEANQRKEYENC